MNREQAKQLLPIIQAFADGAEVQYEGRMGDWRDAPEPCFSPYDNYRIKPKPVERWVLISAGGSDLNEPAFLSSELASEAADKYIIAPRIVHMREVTE